MNDSTFRFKQFSIAQDKCAMKVGTDAVLLGSWVNAPESQSVLDIGTGTGIIAMMIAQKTDAIIDAIDIDEKALEQARYNALNSIWKHRINIFHISLQNHAKHIDKKYDLIISNPPYFDETYKPAEVSRNNARHTDNLSFGDLAEGVRKLLEPHGKFFVILPLNEGNIFIEIMKTEGLFCNELVRVKSKISKPEKRLMMQFSFTKTELKESMLIIRNEDHSYSDEYINLTKDYYVSLK